MSQSKIADFENDFRVPDSQRLPVKMTIKDRVMIKKRIGLKRLYLFEYYVIMVSKRGFEITDDVQTNNDIAYGSVNGVADARRYLRKQNLIYWDKLTDKAGDTYWIYCVGLRSVYEKLYISKLFDVDYIRQVYKKFSTQADMLARIKNQPQMIQDDICYLLREYHNKAAKNKRHNSQWLN